MKTYELTITGRMPMLMHHDNIEWSDAMDEWKADAQNKKTSKAGDDRSPAFRWIGAHYHDGQFVCIPTQNISKCLMEGAAMVPVPGAKGSKTFKAQTQSGMAFSEAFAALRVHGNVVPWEDIASLMDEKDFKVHQKRAADLGFMLYMKRAKIGMTKHIRVRPRFDNWSLSTRFNVFDEQLTPKVLTEIASYAGTYKGLGDWRPGGKTPGPWGTFDATVTEV